jgi:phospholipid/cholesterol/gamma-HCH transport system substrate-binding protein
MRRTDDFAVGGVVLLGAAVIVAATLWARQSNIGQREAGVAARFRDVGNVQVGNAVLIRGVRAGRIKNIELTDEGWVQVRMMLDPTVHLPDDPAVVLGASSLFGEWQASIMPRSAVPDNPDVQRQITQAGGDPQVYPGATLPDIAQLTGVAGRIAGDVASVADRVQVAFNDSAARELRQSIRNTEVLTSRLAAAVDEQSANMGRLVGDVRKGVRAFNGAAATLQRTTVRVDSAMSSEQLARTVDDAGQAAAQLREATLELRAVTRRLATTQGNLDVALARADSLLVKLNDGRGSLGQLVENPSLYRNSDSLVVELRSLVADIRAHPKKYVSLKMF